jgi:hypothetical protein
MEARAEPRLRHQCLSPGDEERPRGESTLLARPLRRQSIGALTGRGAFPCHGLRSHNRLGGVVRQRRRGRCSLCLKAVSGVTVAPLPPALLLLVQNAAAGVPYPGRTPA